MATEFITLGTPPEYLCMSSTAASVKSGSVRPATASLWETYREVSSSESGPR